MITMNDLRDQITRSLTDQADGIDVDAVAETIRDRYGLVDIDSIDSAEYWEIVRSHDDTQQTMRIDAARLTPSTFRHLKAATLRDGTLPAADLLDEQVEQALGYGLVEPYGDEPLRLSGTGPNVGTLRITDTGRAAVEEREASSDFRSYGLGSVAADYKDR